MDWELKNFFIDRSGGLAQVFHLEVLAGNSGFDNKQVVFVDGLIFKNGRIRFNRETEISSKLEEQGISIDSLVDSLQQEIAKSTGQGMMLTA